jgi:NTE family protein
MTTRANNLQVREAVRAMIPPDGGAPVPVAPEAPTPPAPRLRLGLALSCGAAKGLAHIGVIQVLEENGIHIDAIAGSSMGAYIAAVWGFGHDGVKMEALARLNEGRFGLRHLIDPVFPPRQGFMRGEAVIGRLRDTLGHLHFSDMVRPVRVVATDLQTLERVVFSKGEVARAVHASIAIPGVCVPVSIDGRTYMDGGISDPLPVDVVREMGVDRVIAVNVIPPPSFMRCCEEMEREQAEIRGCRRGWLGWLNQHINYFAPGNILDTMMRAVHGAQLRVAEAACRRADLVLRPLTLDASWIEFNKPRKYIELGRRAAAEHLDEIKQLVTGPPRAMEDYDTAPSTMGTVA